MTKLSKYEKETIINWNEAENLASIYTFNASLKRRLADFSRKYPLLCRLERSTPEGSVTYVLDKSPAVCPAHPALQRGTESRRQRLRQRAWLSGGDGRRKNSLKSGRLRQKCRVCTRCFDRQSPQAYSVSTSRRKA